MRHHGSLSLAFGVLLLSGCGSSDETKISAIVGALLIDGTGGVPVSDSVVLVVGSRFRAAGPRALVPVPQGSEQIDGRGKFLVPGLVDLYARPASAAAFLRYGVTSVAAAPGTSPPAGGSGLHWYSSPLKKVSTLMAVEQDLGIGEKQFLGMILDTVDLDQALLARFRDLRVLFAPMLAGLEGSAELLERSKTNTARLAAAGVRLGVASGGTSGAATLHEIELLSQTGIAPMDVIVAGARNGAAALARSNEFGTIEPGRRADLLVLSANPLEDARNLGKLDRVMLNGEWVKQ